MLLSTVIQPNNMSILLIFFLLLNLAISAFNAWSVGRGWVESRTAGGLARFMSWMGATMSACGFTWCYLVLICFVGHAIPGKYHLPDKYAEGIFRLGYLFMILPLIGSGLAITVQSWMYFWRERCFSSGAVATWNTFADIYNIYEACSAIPESFGFLKDLFNSSEDDDEDSGNSAFLLKLMVGLAILAVIGGIVTTVSIVMVTARGVARSQLSRQ